MSFIDETRDWYVLKEITLTPIYARLQCPSKDLVQNAIEICLKKEKKYDNK